MVVGRLLSFWDGLFLGSMLVSGRILCLKGIHRHEDSEIMTTMLVVKLMGVPVVISKNVSICQDVRVLNIFMMIGFQFLARKKDCL